MIPHDGFITIDCTHIRQEHIHLSGLHLKLLNPLIPTGAISLLMFGA
jgi:hypothetical protein